MSKIRLVIEPAQQKAWWMKKAIRHMGECKQLLVGDEFQVRQGIIMVKYEGRWIQLLNLRSKPRH